MPIRYDPQNDYYRILGVQPTATQAEINQAFRKLAKSTHPDTNRDVDPTFFKRLNEAYQVLKGEQRAEYDRLRNIALNHGGFRPPGHSSRHTSGQWHPPRSAGSTSGASYSRPQSSASNQSTSAGSGNSSAQQQSGASSSGTFPGNTFSGASQQRSASTTPPPRKYHYDPDPIPEASSTIISLLALGVFVLAMLVPLVAPPLTSLVTLTIVLPTLGWTWLGWWYRWFPRTMEPLCYAVGCVGACLLGITIMVWLETASTHFGSQIVLPLLAFTLWVASLGVSLAAIVYFGKYVKQGCEIFPAEWQLYQARKVQSAV